MRWMIVVGVGLALGTACTKDNPHACGETDPCTDPALPYCDLDGTLAGTPGECIAVNCTPGAFVSCDGDRALQCDAAGTNYEEVVCELGCDEAGGGCRLCEPNQTACTNGVTATCDASGAVIAQTACALGCFESEPRCREVDPSNGLAQYLDLAKDAPGIEAAVPLHVDTLNGTISHGGGTLGVPSFLLTAPPGGVRIRVFIASHIDVQDMYFAVLNSFDTPPPAAAFVSAGDVTLHGRVLASIDAQNQQDWGPFAPGSVITGICAGAAGRYIKTPNAEYVVGAGGGGNATAGGAGGGLLFNASGGAGGASHGNETIEPLVGGCAGGGLHNDFTGTQIAPYTGAGGGALQIVSATRISITTSGSIAANGAGGFSQFDGGSAGGAGGSILLEAPTIELAAGASLTANGGSGAGGNPGGAGNTPGHDGALGTAQAPGVTPTGGVCTSPALCGTSGAGGALDGPASAAEDIGYNQDANRYAGGGGGAAGRIRINTADGSYIKASDVIESPAVSAGVVRTR